MTDPSKIDDDMGDFASNLSFRRKFAAEPGLTGQRVFKWDPLSLGAEKVVKFEQKTAVRFRLVRSRDWILEIARFDTFDVAGNATDDPPLLSTKWRACMWNTEWDSTFSENTGLRIGECAKWIPKLGLFFPNAEEDAPGPDKGLKNFLQNVQDVAFCLEGGDPLPPHLRV